MILVLNMIMDNDIIHYDFHKKQDRILDCDRGADDMFLISPRALALLIASFEAEAVHNLKFKSQRESFAKEAYKNHLEWALSIAEVPEWDRYAIELCSGSISSE